jgi:hypothetical protein
MRPRGRAHAPSRRPPHRLYIMKTLSLLDRPPNQRRIANPQCPMCIATRAFPCTACGNVGDGSSPWGRRLAAPATRDGLPARAGVHLVLPAGRSRAAQCALFASAMALALAVPFPWAEVGRVARTLDWANRSVIIILAVGFAVSAWLARPGELTRRVRRCVWGLSGSCAVLVSVVVMYLQSIAGSPYVGTYLLVVAGALGFVGAILMTRTHA